MKRLDDVGAGELPKRQQRGSTCLARSWSAASRLSVAYENESIDVTGSGQAWFKMGIEIGTKGKIVWPNILGHLALYSFLSLPNDDRNARNSAIQLDELAASSCNITNAQSRLGARCVWSLQPGVFARPLWRSRRRRASSPTSARCEEQGIRIPIPSGRDYAPCARRGPNPSGQVRRGGTKPAIGRIDTLSVYETARPGRSRQIARAARTAAGTGWQSRSCKERQTGWSARLDRMRKFQGDSTFFSVPVAP